jgi:hypothetical protein
MVFLAVFVEESVESGSSRLIVDRTSSVVVDMIFRTLPRVSRASILYVPYVSEYAEHTKC